MSAAIRLFAAADGDLGATNSIWLIDPAASVATKYRLVFLCQVDAERKRMTGVTASAKAVYPMITNADAGRGQGVVAGERLISSGVVVRPAKITPPAASRISLRPCV